MNTSILPVAGVSTLNFQTPAFYKSIHNEISNNKELFLTSPWRNIVCWLAGWFACLLAGCSQQL